MPARRPWQVVIPRATNGRPYAAGAADICNHPVRKMRRGGHCPPANPGALPSLGRLVAAPTGESPGVAAPNEEECRPRHILKKMIDSSCAFMLG